MDVEEPSTVPVYGKYFITRSYVVISDTHLYIRQLPRVFFMLGIAEKKMFPLVIQSDFWCRAKVTVGREDNACLQVISLRAILGWVIWWDVLIGCQSQRLCLWVTLAKERTRENRFNERMTIFNPNYALPWWSPGQFRLNIFTLGIIISVLFILTASFFW